MEGFALDSLGLVGSTLKPVTTNDALEANAGQRKHGGKTSRLSRGLLGVERVTAADPTSRSLALTRVGGLCLAC